MHRTIPRKEKRRKKVISNFDKTTRAPSKKDKKKNEASDIHDTQVGMSKNVFENPSIGFKFKENQDYDPEFRFLQGKVTELVNQRDYIARHLHTLAEANEWNHLNSINSDSLLSEICHLKSIVGVLQKGLAKLLDEHSAMKSLLMNKIKDVVNLLETDFTQESSKDYQDPRECQGNYFYSKCKENSGFMLPKYSITGQSLHDIWKAPSFVNYSNSNLFNTISRISNIFDNGKNDSLAKFRQLAEIKIIIEILQKYSKIVTDEFKNVQYNMDHPNQNSLDLKFKTNTITHDKLQSGSITSGMGNLLDLTYYDHPPISRTKNICNNYKITKSDNQLKVSSNILMNNPPRGLLKNLTSNHKRFSKITKKVSCKKIVFKKENYWNLNKDEHIANKSLGIFNQDDKESKKKNVLFLSDCHGRFCTHILQDELGSSFSVISVIKPDALFEEIVKDFHHLASTFSREDYVIIFAGSNNIKLKNKTDGHIDVDVVLPILKHTNIVFTMIPLLFDRPSLNPQIRTVNSENFKKIYALAKKNSNILLVPKFSFFSKDHPHQNFNKTGKKTLCKLLAKTILIDTFEKSKHFWNNSQQIQLLSSPPCTPMSNQCLIDENKNETELGNGKCLYEFNNSKANTFVICDGKRACEPIKSDHKNKKCAQTQTSMETQQHSQVEICYENHHSDEDGHKQGFFAGIFMKNNQANMTTIKELLGQGDIPKPRKNFIQENVKRLKELKLEKTNKLSSQRGRNQQVLQPLMERRNAQTMVSSSRFSQRSVNVRPASQSPPPRSRRTIKHVTLDTQTPVVEVDDNPRGYRSQGCQTLSSKQLEHLYEEGVIRYPSARDVATCADGDSRIVREMALQTELPLEVLHPPPSSSPPSPADEGLHWDEEKKGGDKDYVKLNATVPDPRRHKTPDPTSTDPNRAPSTYQRGKVPKYLREHKKEMERERMNKVREDECPEGHIQLPEDIKQKHLSTLRNNYAELVSQLNQLPVSTDTLRTRTRKKQIEADLDRIEAAIALFSREKVFVKADS